MSISSTVRKAGPFLGNGSASVFPFGFKVFTSADLSVIRLDTSGTLLTLALTTDYIVTLNPNQDSNPGGSITLVAGALATGYSLVVTTAIPELQNVVLQNLGAFFPDVINDALDRLTILIQQMQEQVDRSLKFPLIDPLLASTLPIAASRANLLLGFDGTGALTAFTPSISFPGSTTNTVAFSATPTFDLSLGIQQSITLTGNVTSSTGVLGTGAPAIFVMRITQDGTGGRTFVWPTNFDNAGLVSPVANSTSVQMFAVGANGRATALGPIMYS